jgi:tRNA-dihydrouridine synthase B
MSRLRDSAVSGVLVGRGALRNPWIFSQTARAVGGELEAPVTLAEKGQFLLDYIELLLRERVGEREGFRHVAPGLEAAQPGTARGRERWVINKVRALASWYTKGLDGGAALRVRINSSESIGALRNLIAAHFMVDSAQSFDQFRDSGVIGQID